MRVACLCCLVSVRREAGQRCSPSSMGGFGVLRPARRIHIQPRGRVLPNPPHRVKVPLRCGPDSRRAWPLWAFGSARGSPVGASRAASRADFSASASLPFRPASLPASSHAIFCAILRRRDTGFLVSLESRGASAEPVSSPSLRLAFSALSRASPAALFVQRAEALNAHDPTEIHFACQAQRYGHAPA